MAKCDRCKKKSEKYDCAECKPDYKITNADKIRAMNDEELAEYLDNNFCHRYCCCEREQQSTLEWLQSEA